MSLNIEIKPDERIIIGETLITNDGHRARLTIEGNTPILRKKDIMLVEEDVSHHPADVSLTNS